MPVARWITVWYRLYRDSTPDLVTTQYWGPPSLEVFFEWSVRAMLMSWETPSLTIRNRSGDEVALCMQQVSPEVMRDVLPWRTFRWYKGQLHYPGLYWCATEARLIGYESRSELTRLVMADFDVAAKRIVSQPFRLTATIGEE